MPCLAQDPTQTAKTRDSHGHIEIRVLDETIVNNQSNQDKQSSSGAAEGQLLLEQESVVGLRKLLSPVDFNNANITEEELAAKLATFDAIREVQADVLRRHRFKNVRSSNLRKQQQQQQLLGHTLVESILDAVALKKYKVPLCFREIDDDLEVIYNEALNALD